MSQTLEFHKSLRLALREGDIDNNFYLKNTAECAYFLMREGKAADAMYLLSHLTTEYIDEVMPKQAIDDVVFAANIVTLAGILVDKGYVGDTVLMTAVTISKVMPS